MATPPKGTQHLDAADALATSATERFQSQLDALGQLAARLIGNRVNGMSTARGGALRPTRPNLEALKGLQRELAALTGEGSAYAGAVTDLVGTLGPTRQLLNEYVAAQELTVPARLTQLAGQLDAVAVEQLRAGAPAALAEVVQGKVLPGLLQGAQAETVATEVKTALVENQLLPKRLDTTVTDVVEQSSRRYLQAVSDDLGLSHYFYKGTRIDTSRPFCNGRVGRYYTQAEVESWADETWSGKNPATDKLTIFTLVGGYRCRHRLVPVTKAVFESRSGRA